MKKNQTIPQSESSNVSQWLAPFQLLCDLFYPRQCQICASTDRCERFAFLCDSCFEGVSRIQPPWCDRCGLPFPDASTFSGECANCSEITLHFDRALGIVRFNGVARIAIHSLKYSRQTYWTRALQAWFVEGATALSEPEDFDLILPVPLHPWRERNRGFNQAWFLAQSLSKLWKIPTSRNALVRVRATETQTHLDRVERLQNLKDAFKVKTPRDISGKRILLVDDVLTTGATTSECSRVLKKAGAISILVFTLARG